MPSQYLQRPAANEYAAYYEKYATLVPETDILQVLREQTESVRALISSLSAEQEAFRYAPGKWSIRQLMGHINDGERVFGFRAFAFAHGEAAALPGFDENDYVRESNFDQTPLQDLLAHFILLRESNVLLLEQLAEGDWGKSGVASDNPVTVRALVWIMAGHVRHHLNILRDRYLTDVA
ncbi:MAG: DinB family protein [Acidobacteria bacterium]|nr:DinB family protein [Acidobacteriota bacterium]